MRLRRPPILGPDEVGERLGLLVVVRAVGVLLAVAVVRVRVVGRADVLHAVDAAALRAALDGAVAGHLFGGWGWVSERALVGGFWGLM